MPRYEAVINRVHQRAVKWYVDTKQRFESCCRFVAGAGSTRTGGREVVGRLELLASGEARRSDEHARLIDGHA